MKILIKLDENNARVMEGLHNAAFDCGFKSLIWDERTRPSFDVVAEFKPELVVCYGDTQGSAIESACKEYSVKIVNVSPTNISGDMLATFHKPSADLLKCNQNKEKENDIVTLSEIDDRQILKLAKMGIKCFSYKNKLNPPCYLGVVTSEESHELLCSSKMFFIFSDDSELMCSCIASDCIPMVINNKFLDAGIFPILDSQENLEAAINKISSDNEYRLNILREAKKFVFSSYTYHHRLSEVMQAAGKHDKSNLILERLEEYK